MEYDWDYGGTFILPLQVKAEHIDGMGHANNCEYLKWLENSAWAHSHELGFTIENYKALDRGLVARRTELDYLAAAFLDDNLLVGTWLVENDGRLSITRAYQIVRASDGVTILRAKTRWVCIALSDGKPKRLPEEYKKGYFVTAIQKEGGPAVVGLN